MAEFEIKQHNTSPSLDASLSRQSAVGSDPTPLQGAQVVFLMREQGRPGYTVVGPAEIVDADEGIVEYHWVEGDTAEAGDYYGEFDIVRSDGSYETIPNGDPGFTIKINPHGDSR